MGRAKKSPESSGPRAITGLPNSGAWSLLALSLLSATRPDEGRKAHTLVPRELLDRLAPLARARLSRRGSGGPASPLVIVREREEDLEDVLDGLRAFLPLTGTDAGGEPAFFGEDPQARLASLERLHQGAPLVFATAESLGGPVSSRREYEGLRIRVCPGNLPRKDLLARLARLGYRRVDFVESPGEYSVRGAVVDFFPVEPLRAVRVLYDGDVVETVRAFDPETQASLTDLLDEAVVTPVREKDSTRTLGELLSERGLWVVEEGLEDEKLPAGASAAILRVAKGAAGAEDAMDFGASAGLPTVSVMGTGRSGPGAASRLDAVAKLCADWRSKGCRVLLFSMNRGEDERIQEMLEDRLPAGAVQFLIGPLRQGFVSPRLGLAALTSGEIFGRSYRAARAWKAPSGRARVRWGELKKGDFVVHELYGVSRYLGLESVETGDPRAEETGGIRGVMDCLRLEFRGGDSLFVPMTEFRCVQKYVGAEGHRPRLSSLDTRTWKQVVERVREGVRELARRLLKVAAQRRALPGHAFGVETRMEREFAESFPFEETPDQRKAIEDTAADMAAPHPMDRVVVGDVGFGKTEVAMRAALKCVAGARQAAVLVPTTVLADQHTRTFRKRFAEYPVRIEMLSRFQTRGEQKDVLKAVAAGKVDVVVGTHRLLQKDVKFRDLGLLVIDEEHRFGVKDKEKLKDLRRTVDCLSLSATPIPRTLHQCMSGLRQVSLIQSAPTGRQPITTVVRPWDERHVASAIEAELERGGQVFYVHNRVRSLPETKSRLEELVPGARFGLAHGQMRSDALEKTMWSFFSREYDVLVASSIIESGLDIPTVNTLLIENSQDFGLSQLYQLRGRIGRERIRAYCCLYYPSDVGKFRALSEEARKRLDALKEFGSLGSGFSLAMRDLEIRGAGDLLGAKQHGFLNAVGVEFYSELLEEEVGRLKGRAPKSAKVQPAHLDLGIAAHIPEDYLPGDLERIQFYKRLLDAPPGELERLRGELIDLSGPLPEPVRNLFRVLRIRGAATGASIRSVVRRGGRVEIYFRPKAEIPTENISRWMGVYKERIRFVPSPEGDGLKVDLGRRDPIEWIEDFLEGMAPR